MYEAQKQGFDNEGQGTYISEETAQLLIGPDKTPSPILGKDTTLEDLTEANFVMSMEVPVTQLDLERRRPQQGR